ncbi:MAG: response regulator, partial [Desulfuromonadales bacterium]|nr:response regulator [Desulfuromonadales bacterium]
MALRTNPIILTIDDEENIRTSFRMFLEDYDYQVVEAKNGREGLEVFAQEKPDLVICDLRMPEVDGLEVIEKITENSPDTPIIVVSGTGVVGDAIEAIHSGAWNYLLKPITDMNVLLHAINQSMERSRLIIENRAYQEHLEHEVTKRTQALQKAVTDLNQSNARLKTSEQKYRVIFDNLQDVYMEVALDGNIIEVSPSISQISQYCRDDVVNLKIDQIFPNKWSRDRLFALLRDESSISDFELQLQDKDKTMIPCSINASYHTGIGQATDKICATIRDVTD